MSFDALVATDADARYYVEQRFDRPALVNGARETLPALPGNLPGLTAWICEQGAAMVRGAGQLGSGQTLLAVPASEDSGTYALVDPATLDDTDVATGTLRNAVGAGDRLIVTVPAFADTPEGDVIDTSGPVGTNGAALLRRTRNGLIDDVTHIRPSRADDGAARGGGDRSGGRDGRGRHHTGSCRKPRSAALAAGPPRRPGVRRDSRHGRGDSGPLAGALAMLMRERWPPRWRTSSVSPRFRSTCPPIPAARRRSAPYSKR